MYDAAGLLMHTYDSVVPVWYVPTPYAVLMLNLGDVCWAGIIYDKACCSRVPADIWGVPVITYDTLRYPCDNVLYSILTE